MLVSTDCTDATNAILPFPSSVEMVRIADIKNKIRIQSEQKQLS